MAETCIPFLDKTCSGTRPYEQTTTNDYECINSSNQHSIVRVWQSEKGGKNTSKFIMSTSKGNRNLPVKSKSMQESGKALHDQQDDNRFH